MKDSVTAQNGDQVKDHTVDASREVDPLEEIFHMQADGFWGWSEKGFRMPSNSATNGNDRIEVLQRREAALKAAIAAEKVRQQKKAERDDARVFSIIGEALVTNAGRHSDFDLMLKSVLKATSTFTEGEVKLLRKKGWL